jgi:arsenate reductase
MGQTTKKFNVLFLCTGNSARSLIAECLLRRYGAGKFGSYSAGSHPRPAPDPMVLQELQHQNYDVSELRSKDWDEFAQKDSPHMDFVFTVCDKARGEVCPVWPGQPMTAHWGADDPHAFEGSDEERRWLIRRVMRELEHRIRIFVSLPFESLDRLAIQAQLDEIGESSGQKSDQDAQSPASHT